MYLPDKQMDARRFACSAPSMFPDKQMDELGAYTQMDLLDLEPNEYQLLMMRPLEAKRFEQAMIALEEEFLSAPAAPVPVAGNTWKEDSKKSSGPLKVASTSGSLKPKEYKGR
jgi:hypothetical protein